MDSHVKRNKIATLSAIVLLVALAEVGYINCNEIIERLSRPHIIMTPPLVCFPNYSCSNSSPGCIKVYDREKCATLRAIYEGDCGTIPSIKGESYEEILVKKAIFDSFLKTEPWVTFHGLESNGSSAHVEARYCKECIYCGMVPCFCTEFHLEKYSGEWIVTNKTGCS